MLSRVAAVKAPRTHNRRRVTGSSGRRREGGESEPQRSNMSRRVFTSAVPLLLVVMMCCSTCGAAAADEDLPVVPKYQLEEIADVNLESLGAPGLLKVGSGVFVVAEAQCKKDGEDTFTGVAFQLLTIKGDNTPEEALKKARVIQFLEKGISTEGKKVEVSRPTTVVDESDIYMLVGKHSQNAGQGSGAAQSGLLLVKGTVSAEGDDSRKKIQWNVNQLPVGTLSEGEHDSSMQLIGGGGSGVKMNDGTLVFPVEGTKKDDDKTEEDGKTVSLIFYSSDAESWTLSKGMSADGCGVPSVVEWKDKLMMMTACDDGGRRVYESGDKGNTWTEALGTLSRVWGSKQKGEAKAVGSGFITATFGDEQKNVMLVTLPVYAKENGEKENKKGELHLWLTDNTHIVDIGPVSGKDDDAAASALLYKSRTDANDEKLIALYEKKVDGESSNSLWSVRLTEQLQRVKDVLATWKEVDEHVSGLCSSENAAKAPSTDSACSTKITAGLVGFLSGNFSDNTWRDEYLGVNATVKEGAEEGAAVGVAETAGSSDGVKFQGTWAEWPVGSQGENQLYHFANYNFTLVATVSIDGEPTKEGDTLIPLMGAKMSGDDKTVLLGLSYGSGMKWQVLCDGKPTEMQNRIEGQEKTHQVAIVLQNGTQGSVYVDGQRVLENVQCQLEGREDKKISHFYIGGDGSNTEGQGGVSVTVTNVLLYNRPLDGNEITALNAIKPPITPPKETRAQEIVLPSPGRTPQAGQEPLNGGQGVVGGSASSAASIATTPSSDVAQTVATMGGDKMQGDGSHQTPEVSMSSGEDGETAGGTDGQEEEIHPQDRDVNATALSSSLGNVSQGNNTDAGTVRGSRLPSLLLLLLGLWGFAAL
ncbi:trans-sialidase [Trypanosoma cruzi cruzi]|uniref:Putative trans-sialidase, Group VI n=1 Tax=Trypanosoma cruzi TaxID=5693 RepID=A0A2V2UWB8_TRYCR|nr:trans-sialidase [Trypanosoma cruzi cruzi]PWU88545.1 putative trans-sialidase, Group VI [Trypanosoma cruzi]